MKFIKAALKTLLIVIGVPVIAFILMILYLTVREYKPESREELPVEKAALHDDLALLTGDSLTVVTWNIGYGALGENADFFMDGGKGVYTTDKTGLEENLSGMKEILSGINPDIVLLQEADTDSSRSFHTDEYEYFRNLFPTYDGTFAYNYKADFVPFPIPPIGKVNSGLITLSNYDMERAERISLPCPFKWPVRVANLKRCLSVNRIPIVDSEKDLVIVNLHLEAFDDGEGKIAQTKMLCDFLKAELESGNYIIAGGDFNQSFSSTDTSLYPELPGCWHSGLLDESAFDERLSFYQPSAASGRSLDRPLAGETDLSSFQFYIIDGYIVSDNLTVTSVETIDHGFKYTDHNPVVLKVTINP